MTLLIHLLLGIGVNQILARETVNLNLIKNEKNEIKLAFGSCYGIFDRKSDIFKTITENDPALWIWLGDAAYTDNVRLAGGTKFFLNILVLKDNSMPTNYAQHRFEMTIEDKYYQKLLQKTPVVGVWDDHDYGCNNGDKTFKNKRQMRDIFLDFIGEPNNTQRRLEIDTGIYQDYVYFDNEENIKIHLILVDIRYDFDEKTQDRFGEEQLAWLDRILGENKDSNLTLIGMGVQALVDRYFFTEAINWKSKEMLFDLIRKHQKSGVFVLSGDVHFAQFYHTNCKSLTGYDVQELTSSGMTHHVNSFFKIGHHVLNYVTPLFWNVYVNYNFGLLKTRKIGDDLEFTIQVKTLDDQIALEKVLMINRDMKYDEENNRYQGMCKAIHSKSRIGIQFHHYLYMFIVKRHWLMYLLIMSIFGVKSLLLAGVIRLIRKTSGLCRQSKVKVN
ncbi:UNKNOWN [Stylonychia lemnae]|uniref:PhoD-like phosphatase metallophosphatase domain-containing protein n=1 Tax=Stylonychia lemnae TaxID=5949 RepID=A0A078B9E7_STYLE|nr:UNKNOWN [Stylonychia lemnae]|eukprot:CDW89877.1 UNKNOWN [Stylonychia lemnae]